MAWQAEEGPAGKNDAYVSLSKGWALGSDAFKAALVKDHALLALSRAWEDIGAAEVRRLQWAAALAGALKCLGKTETDCAQERKSVPWKIAIAAYLKTRTQASNGWLSQHLRMGSPVALSDYIGRLRRHGGEAAPLLARLGKTRQAI